MSSDLSSNPTAAAAGSPAPGGPAAAAIPLDYQQVPKPKSAWSPLAVPAFKALWFAYLISLIGTWAREAGGPWLMEAMKEKSPGTVAFWVSLIQPAGTLPICLLSISAGVFADIYDRRKLLIYSNVWMLVVSSLLGIVTLAGGATPQLLLAFTFLLGVGAALAGPAFQYVIPELVPPSELPLAIALNSVALNVARAVGPVLGMLVILLVGIWAGKIPSIGASFMVNAAAFIGVIWVLARWERGDQKRSPHPETLLGATTTAFRYTMHSPAMRAILVRVAGFILCAVIVWAQLPIMAKQLLHGEDVTYMLLMGAVGVGAVIGVMFMPKMDKRFSTDGMVVICTIAFGLAVMALSLCRGTLATLWLALPLMMVVGFNWVIVPTNFNIATQRSVPGWVKGRAIAMYTTILFGSFAVGSPIWGAVTSRFQINTALLISGALVVLGSLLAIPFPLTRARGHDFGPANHPAPGDAPPGPANLEMVLAYPIERARAEEFATIMRHNVRPQRLRNGATQWKLAPRDDAGESSNGTVIYEERFAFTSWSDRLRFHARTTKADAAAEEAALGFVVGPRPEPTYRAMAVGFPVSPLASQQTPMPSRHMPSPPPMVDWDYLATRFLEELGTIINRAMGERPERRDWRELNGRSRRKP
jgi:MFS family permease